MHLMGKRQPTQQDGTPLYDPYKDIREQQAAVPANSQAMSALPLIKQVTDGTDPRFAHLVAMRSSADKSEFQQRAHTQVLQQPVLSEEEAVLQRTLVEQMEWVRDTELSPHDATLLRGSLTEDAPMTVQEYDVTLVAYRCRASIGPSTAFERKMKGVHKRVVDALVRDVAASRGVTRWEDVSWQTTRRLEHPLRPRGGGGGHPRRARQRARHRLAGKRAAFICPRGQ